jgi:hypothetical protein
VAYTFNPSTQRHKDFEFEISLGYIVTLCLRKPKPRMTKIENKIEKGSRKE